MFHFYLNGSVQLLFCPSIHLGTKNLENCLSETEMVKKSYWRVTLKQCLPPSGYPGHCTMRLPMSIDISEVLKCKHSFHAHFKKISILFVGDAKIPKF